MDIEVTKEMIYAFCNAISDASITHQEYKEVEIGLKAALCNINIPSCKPAVAVPDGLIDALKSYWQIDAHGSGAGVSRQALDEAIEIIESITAAPSHSQQISQSVPLATVMDLRAYMDEFGRDADLNVIRSELGEMIRRANGTYDNSPSHDKNTQDTPKA